MGSFGKGSLRKLCHSTLVHQSFLAATLIAALHCISSCHNQSSIESLWNHCSWLQVGRQCTIQSARCSWVLPHTQLHTMTPPPQALQTALPEVADILRNFLRKIVQNRFYCASEGCEILRKFCRNSPKRAEKFSARTRTANALPDARSSAHTLPPWHCEWEWFLIFLTGWICPWGSAFKRPCNRLAAKKHDTTWNSTLNRKSERNIYRKNIGKNPSLKTPKVNCWNLMGIFPNEFPGEICRGFFVDFLRPFPLETTRGKDPPKNPWQNSNLNLGASRHQNPHCKNLPLTKCCVFWGVGVGSGNGQIWRRGRLGLVSGWLWMRISLYGSLSIKRSSDWGGGCAETPWEVPKKHTENTHIKVKEPQAWRLEGPVSENSRRLWLFPVCVRQFPRKTPAKSRENCRKMFPESRNATNSRISGTGKGKLAGNLGSTLPGPCPHLPCGVSFGQFQPSRVLLGVACVRACLCMRMRAQMQRLSVASKQCLHKLSEKGREESMRTNFCRERKMHTNFFCTKFLNTPRVRDIPAKFPGHPRFLSSKPKEDKLSREGTKFSATTPSRGRPPPHRAVSGPKKLIFVLFFLSWIAPPLRMLSKGETLRKRGGGIAPNWPYWDTKNPIARDRGVSLS